jgi:hypothetical protein
MGLPAIPVVSYGFIGSESRYVLNFEGIDAAGYGLMCSKYYTSGLDSFLGEISLKLNMRRG